MDNIQILQESYSRITLIPVIGSGISVPYGLPDWKTLIENAADFFKISADKKTKIYDHLNHYEFVDAVDVILEEGISELELQQYVSECMFVAKKNAPKVDSNYSDLGKMEKIRYMTTNYDQYINDITGARTFCLDELEKINVNQFVNSPYDHTVIPLHGEISRPGSIVLSRNSYMRLYDSERFNEEFQYLRTHFTFLFIGFSFEDEYVQLLFDKVLQRFEAQHFILFEKSVGIDNQEKIERLREKYGIEAVYYDASLDGHTKAINKWLSEIFQLKDQEIDLKDMPKLPESGDLKIELGEKEKIIVNNGKEYIGQERLTDLYNLYWAEYSALNFNSHSIQFQLEIIRGLLWYYGFQRQEKECSEIMERVKKDPVISKYENRLSLMYVQLLWNTREFTRGIEVLNGYKGSSRLVVLLQDLLNVYQKFLPERDEVKGVIPVYGEIGRSEDEQKQFKEEYLKLKEKYINQDTYNLKNLDSYENRESQQIAYYWLGIAAGQLFHAHADAIQYLLRSYELTQLMVTCEELANNYLAQALEDIRYVKDPKKYQMDMNLLLKAKIRFQYIMNFSDKTVVYSMYKRSGFAYLQTLYWLKDYIVFYEFYDKSAGYIPETKDLVLLKAEADAEYEHIVDEAVLEKLDAQDRRFIEYCCVLHRGNVFSMINPNEGIRLRKEILYQADKDQPINDQRVIKIVMDTAFLLKDKVYYEKLKKIYPQEYFRDMQDLGLEDELYGRIDEAEKKLKYAFSIHKDYDGTFRILKSFYVRNKKRTEYELLLKELMENPPDDMYKRPQFYAERIMSELNDWHDQWHAMTLYYQYYDRIKDDLLLRKELEEALKIYSADYCDYEDRIAWNRFMLNKVPKYAQFEIYLSILKLYVANLKYREASNVLIEMKKLKVPVGQGFDKLISVCLRQQTKKFYCGSNPYYSSDNDYLSKLVREANTHWRYQMHGFAAAGEKIILPMKYLICIFKQGRQKELVAISRIYIMYAGIVNLQNSLWSKEDSFLRMILQWIAKTGNIELAAPDFMTYCQCAPKEYNINYSAEEVQLKLYSKEHPDYICI